MKVTANPIIELSIFSEMIFNRKKRNSEIHGIRKLSAIQVISYITKHSNICLCL
jgi:hypothetical protein